MITSRFSEHVKKQHWTGAFIELLIVILGVFIGLQANNWNTARHEAVEAAQYLQNFDAALGRTETWMNSTISFYANLRKNGAIALSLIEKDKLTPDEKSTLYDVLMKMQFVFSLDPENLESYVDKVDQGAIKLNNRKLKQEIAEFGIHLSLNKAIVSRISQRLNSYLAITDHYNAVGPILTDGRHAGLFDRSDARKDPAFRIALAGELNMVMWRLENFKVVLKSVRKMRQRLEKVSK